MLSVLLIVFNLYRAGQKNWNYGDPLDYRALYIGGQLMMNDNDLYNDGVGSVLWDSIEQREHFQATTDFGDPYASVSLYPPHAYIPFLPLSFMPWTYARIAWWLIGALSLALIALLLYRYKRDRILIALLLGLSATYFALSLGQPILPVVALLFLSLYLEKRSPYMAGILLGLATIKVTAALPFLIWFLVRRQYKVVLFAGISGTLLLTPMLMYDPDIVAVWLYQMDQYYAFLYQVGDFNIYTFSDSEFSMMLDYYLHLPIEFWKRFNMVGQLLGYVLMTMLYIKKRFTPGLLMLGLLMVSFVFTYHLVYDLLLFVIPLAYLPKRKAWNVLLGSLLFLSLPVNAVIDRIDFKGLEIFKFNFTLLCTIGLLLIIFVALKPRHANR